MKTLRLVLTFAGAALLGLGVLAGLASSSALQTWAARRLIARRPELRATVGSVSAGLHHVTILDLRFERGGVRFDLPDVEADLSIVEVLLRRELTVRRLEARGCTVDLSGLPAQAGPNGGVPGAGARPRLALLLLASSIPGDFLEGLPGCRLEGPPAGREFDVQGTLLVPGVPAGRTGGLAFEATASPTALWEAYSVEISKDGRPFANVRGHCAEDGSRFLGRWKLDLASGPPDAPGPRGEGTLECTADSVHVAGRIETGAGRFGRLLPDPSSAAGLKVSAEFDAVRRAGIWRVGSLSAALEGRHPILQLTALREFEFNPSTREASTGDPGSAIAGISLRELPLPWLAPWLAPLAVSGGGIRGDMVAVVNGKGLLLRTTGPMAIDGVSASLGGRQLLQGAGISLEATVDVGPEGWQIELSPLRAGSGGRQVFKVDARIGRLAGAGEPLKVAGRMSADLPAFLAQSAAGRRAELKRGDFSCNFTGSFGAQRSIDARIELANLEAVSAGALPAVTAQIRADLGADGRLTFNVPIGLSRDGRESDLTLGGTATRGVSGMVFDLQASGHKMDAGDVVLLAAPFAEAGARLDRPFWSGSGGRVAFAAGTVTWPGGVTATGLEGRIELDADTVRIDGLRGGIGGGSFSMAGDLRFEPGISSPYAYRVDLRLENFDSASFFRALEPDRPPTFQGKFDLIGRFSGNCADVRHIPEFDSGDWSLTSKGGIFRALPGAIESKPQPTDKIAVIGAFIGNMADTVTFRKEARIQERKARAAVDFSQIMTAIPYDRIDVKLAHNASFDTDFREFALISPEIRIEGSGTVAAVAGVPFLERPLAASLKLRVRGRAAELLQAAGLIAPGKDELGYAACSIPLEIGGTLLKPDPGGFRGALQKVVQ